MYQTVNEVTVRQRLCSLVHERQVFQRLLWPVRMPDPMRLRLQVVLLQETSIQIG